MIKNICRINFLLIIFTLSLSAINLFNFISPKEKTNYANVLDNHKVIPSRSYDQMVVLRHYDKADLDFKSFFDKFSKSRLVYRENSILPNYSENYLAFLLNSFFNFRIINYCPRTIIKSGGGLCDDASFLLLNYAKKKNHLARLVQMTGHVVVEVSFDNGKTYLTFDSGNNSYFDKSVKNLNPDEISKLLKKNSTLKENNIEKMVNIYLSHDDNFLNNGDSYYKMCEKFKFYLILSLLTPFFLILLQYFIYRWISYNSRKTNG